MTPLLLTKLLTPLNKPEFVPRPRLMERLNESITRQLTLISAPAGFGKTTLLSEWIEHCEPWVRVAWVSLDEGDNDPTRFWSYFVAALQTIEAHIGEGMLSAMQTLQAPPIETLLTALINEFVAAADDPSILQQIDPEPSTVAKTAGLGLRFVVILDDYHLIQTRHIHDGIAFLLDHLPPHTGPGGQCQGMHLVIATRSDPPLHLARFRGRGQRAELRADDLRFTLEEVAAFLNQRMDLQLATDDIAALASRTECWIAGLQMAAISIQGQRQRSGIYATSEFVNAFTGSHRFVLDYLMEEVLDQQPRVIQEFLLKTSILDRLSGSLCDAIVGEMGEWQLEVGTETPSPGFDHHSLTPGLQSQAILEYLEASNLFINPLDQERCWYRYHQLFSDLLRQRLDRSRPETVPELHRRASAWFESNGAVAEAIRYAASAGDFERAACLIEAAAEPTLMRGQFATFLKWSEALPEGTVSVRPLLCAYIALVLLLSGRPLDRVEARPDDAVQGDTAAQFEGEVTVLQAILATLKGDAALSIELSQKALDLLPVERFFFQSCVAKNLGTLYMLAGDVAAAIPTFEAAVRLDQRADNLTGIVVNLRQLAHLHMLQGKLYKALELYQSALDQAVDGQGRRLPIAIKMLVDLGELWYQWNDLDTAMRFLDEGIELAEKWTKVWGLGIYMGLARVRQAQGDVGGANEAIQTAQRLASEFDATDLDDILVAARQARLWVVQGNLAAAWHWVVERGWDGGIAKDEMEAELGGVFTTFYVREIEYTTLARVYLAYSRPEMALDVLEPLLQAAQRLRRRGSEIEILALQALAYQAQGLSRDSAQESDLKRAVGALERALSLAEPEGYVRLFVDEGEPMAQLLRQVTAAEIPVHYAGVLLAVFESEMGAPCDRRVPRSPRWALVSDHSSQTPALHAQSSGSGADQPTDQREHQRKQESPLAEPLTERELEVLHLLPTHLSSTEMAEELFVAASTVRSHIKSIYGKLNVHSRGDAVQRARELGLL